MPLSVYSQFIADESGRVFWGKKASGLLFVRNHPTLGFQVLLVKRSPHVEQPGTFGVAGGAVEEGEDEFESAVRETQEEIGGMPPCHKVGEYVWRNPGGSFTFKTFVMETEDLNWIPKAFNWEVTGAKWVSMKQMGKMNLHPGLRDMVDAGAVQGPEKSKEDLKIDKKTPEEQSSWLSRVEASADRPPRVIVMSFFPGYLKVMIGDKVYEYQAQESDKNMVESYIRKGARNRAIRHLKKLKLIGKI